jgi:Transmembrane protein 65
MGISTMAAAALGNLVSDVAGVGLGGVVEVSYSYSSKHC